MSSEAKNIDTILVQAMQEQATNSPTQPTVEPSVPEQAAEASPDHEETPLAAEPAQAESEVPQGTSEETLQVEAEKPQVSSESKIDEYGNPVAPEKTYTEEEVQRMMRERLSRVRQPEQPAPAPTVSQPKPEDGEQDWRQELKTFVKETLGEVTKEEQQAQWQQQERQRQADFESKFNVGMSKYQDFHAVVANKPITKDMMLATRGLDNPAAFIYGASKLHPQELGRIAQLADPYDQAAAIGRLHEKMVKSHNGASSAPKPISPPKGDVPNKKVNDRPSIDSLIAQHAEQKNKRR